MPPLGPLYEQKVFVDSTLAAEERIRLQRRDALRRHRDGL